MPEDERATNQNQPNELPTVPTASGTPLVVSQEATTPAQEATTSEAPVTYPPLGPASAAAATTSTPVVQPTPVSVTPTPLPPTKKKKTGLIAVVIAAVVGALLVTGAVLAYNLWYQHPDKVVHDAVINAFTAKTTSGASKLTIAKEDEFSLTLATDGKATQTNGHMTLKADVSITSDDQEVDVQLKAEGMYVDGVLYFKFDKLRETIEQLAESYGSEVPSEAYTIIDKVDGQWVSVSPSDYDEMSKQTADVQKCFADFSKKLGEDAAMQKELVDLYKKHQVLQVEESLGSKSINSVGSLGYAVTLNKENAAALATGLADTAAGKELARCDDSIDYKEISEDITKAETSDSTVTTRVELWVSRFGHEITELNVAAEDDGEGTTVSFVTHPLFNKDVSIVAPKDTITLKQLIKDIETLVEEYSESATEQTQYELENYEYDFS